MNGYRLNDTIINLEGVTKIKKDELSITFYFGNNRTETVGFKSSTAHSAEERHIENLNNSKIIESHFNALWKKLFD